MTPGFDPTQLFEIPDPLVRGEGGPPPPVDLAEWAESPARGRTYARRRAALAAALCIHAIWLTLVGVRHGARPSLEVTVGGVLFPLAAGAILFALSRRSSPRSRKVRASIGIAAAVFVMSTWVTRAPGDRSLHAMVPCLLSESIVAVSSTLIVLFSMRFAFPNGTGWRGAAIGLAGGLVAAASIRLHCGNDGWEHVLAGHGAPIVLTAIVAMALGRRYMRA